MAGIFDGLNRPGNPVFNLIGAASQAGSATGAAPWTSGISASDMLAQLRGMEQTAPDARALVFQQQLARDQFNAQQAQLRQADARRQQMLDLIGLSPQTVGEGGLLGGTFFQSILGSPVSDVVGGITGAITGNGGGQLGQPGFADSPGSPGSPSGGGGGSLFNQQIAGRGEFGRQIMDMIRGYGGSERARIDQQQQTLGNTALARLEARGLGSSNLAGAELERAARFGNEQRAGLEDRLIQQQVAALQGIGEGIFGDVGAELDRGVERQRTGASLLNALLGSAFNTVSL